MAYVVGYLDASYPYEEIFHNKNYSPVLPVLRHVKLCVFLLLSLCLATLESLYGAPCVEEVRERVGESCLICSA